MIAAPAFCQHLNCGVLNQIVWPVLRLRDRQAMIEIGVIDTSVNLDHAGLGDAQIDFVRMSDEDLPASGETHGTAVVALLFKTEARAPGLRPEAKIVAVDIFSHKGGDERAEVVHLGHALDLLARRDVRVVSLSLTGRENGVLSAMLATVEESGMLVVAAAGNAVALRHVRLGLRRRILRLRYLRWMAVTGSIGMLSAAHTSMCGARCRSLVGGVGKGRQAAQRTVLCSAFCRRRRGHPDVGRSSDDPCHRRGTLACTDQQRWCQGRR